MASNYAITLPYYIQFSIILNILYPFTDHERKTLAIDKCFVWADVTLSNVPGLRNNHSDDDTGCDTHL